MKTGTGQVGRRADDQAHAGSEFERSLDRLRNRLAEWRELGKVEAKFNPSQPRVPAGVPDSGRWSGAGGWISTIHLPSGRDILGAAEGAPLKVQEFLQTHRESVTRLLGAVQATGGALEGAAGVALVGSGVATSETGVGIGVAGLGAWMVTNGYDNFDTGLHVLATGAPRATRLNTTLRSFGLTESQADATEVLLAGGEAVGASKLGARALEAAARCGLEREAARAFLDAPLTVKVNGGSLWDSPSIVARGDAWEVYDAARTGFERTPPNFLSSTRSATMARSRSAIRRWT